MEEKEIRQLKDFLDSLLKHKRSDINLSEKYKVLEPVLLSLQQNMVDCTHLSEALTQLAQGNYNIDTAALGGNAEVVSAIVHQLSDRLEASRVQQNLMKKVFDNIEPIFIIDPDDDQTVLYANKLADKRFGIKTGRQPDILNNDFIRKLLSLPRNNRPTQVYDATHGRWYNTICTCLHWEPYENAAFYHCTDITTHKQRENDLQIAANTDELTGLYNRRAYEQYFIQCWELCLQQNRPLSLLLFDIDFFKRYNDTYGHLQGDKCLMTFANILREKFSRATDVISRFGGEEFIALMPFMPGESAVTIAESVRTAVMEQKIIMQKNGKTTETSVTVSCGVSTIIPTEYDDPTVLFTAADSALYLAKETGRNRTCYRDSNTRQ